jgi:hypothetical protein
MSPVKNSRDPLDYSRNGLQVHNQVHDPIIAEYGADLPPQKS